MTSTDFIIFFKLLFFCALRPEEALNLKKSNFNLEEKTLSLRTSRTEKIGQTTIPPIILGDLRKFLKNKKDDDLLFISKNSGKQLKRQIPWDYAREAGKLAGIDVLQITEKYESKGITLLVFRKSFERFLSEKRLEKGLIDLKLRNRTTNRFGNYTLKNLKHVEKQIFKTMYNEEEIKEFSKWYEQNYDIYEKLSNKVKDIVQEILDDRKINIDNIIPRAKDPLEFQNKISKGVNFDPKQMQDLAGIKIICYTKSDVEKIKDAIKEIFKIIRSKEVDYNSKNEDSSGYQYNYYVCEFTKQRVIHSEELQKFSHKPFEIQVRTILQNAWDSIEHDDLYKNKSEISPEIKRRFFLVAKVLESTDNELNNLHKEMIKSKKS